MVCSRRRVLVGVAAAATLSGCASGGDELAEPFALRLQNETDTDREVRVRIVRVDDEVIYNAVSPIGGESTLEEEAVIDTYDRYTIRATPDDGESRRVELELEPDNDFCGWISVRFDTTGGLVLSVPMC
ncbi:hypothetical protein ACNS7O_06955 [Haloferacaceae archaeon DSL9]